MRELSQNIREQTVKLFLQGIIYDDIAWKLRIAKGSVVNIIDEFRKVTNTPHLYFPTVLWGDQLSL